MGASLVLRFQRACWPGAGVPLGSLCFTSNKEEDYAVLASPGRLRII
jgi:hypothetical protein